MIGVLGRGRVGFITMARIALGLPNCRRHDDITKHVNECMLISF